MRYALLVLPLVALLGPAPASSDPAGEKETGKSCLTRTSPEPVATFSIVAHDPEAGEWGVAVQSKFFAVGAVVPFAKAGVGAVATQAYANTTFGPRGLAMMGGGKSAAATLLALVGSDSEGGRRQVGIVDGTGNAVSYTGDGCMEWAGGRIGNGFAVQGNILAGPGVVDAMAKAYETTEGELAVRLVSALRAGQEAGGDRRGRQSAALLVVREGGGYAGFDDRYLDLRVDDHERPIEELGRLLGLWRTRYGGSPMARAFALHRAGKTASAVREARLAVRLEPENGEHRYNLACLLALAGRGEEALGTLGEALRRKPDLVDLARGDADLASIRETPEFRKLLETAGKR